MKIQYNTLTHPKFVRHVLLVHPRNDTPIVVKPYLGNSPSLENPDQKYYVITWHLPKISQLHQILYNKLESHKNPTLGSPTCITQFFKEIHNLASHKLYQNQVFQVLYRVSCHKPQVLLTPRLQPQLSNSSLEFISQLHLILSTLASYKHNDYKTSTLK